MERKRWLSSMETFEVCVMPALAVLITGWFALICRFLGE
jgi:hypothetical protein